MTWFLDQPLTWLVATLLAYRLGVELRDRPKRDIAELGSVTRPKRLG